MASQVEGEPDTSEVAMEDRFSFASAYYPSELRAADSSPQQAGLMIIEHTGAPSTASAYTSAGHGDAPVLQDGSISLVHRSEQEPSLLQVVDTVQEPSLARSSVFAEDTSPPSDGLSSSTSTGSQQAVEAAGTTCNMQPLSSSGGAADCADNSNTGAGPSDEQQSDAAAALQLHLQDAQPVTAALLAAKGAAAEELCYGAEAAANESVGITARQPDKSFFVDGFRAIDIEVDCERGAPCKLVHVLIDVTAVQQTKKAFLGGYRHKHSNAIYHHACSQTPPAPQKGPQLAPAVDAKQHKLSRETQTIKAATSSCQTVREAATQMARRGLELDCSGDRLLTPRPYTTSEVVQQRRQAAAVTIQRYSRGWIARQRAEALRSIKAERDGFLAQAAAEREAAAQEQRRREVERRTHPLSHSDFELLGSELEAWRQQQTAAIKAAAQHQDQSEHGFDQAAALQLLLAKETRLLQTLDKLRVNAKQEVKAIRSEKLLNHLAQPKTWTLSNGKKVMVHTPTTVRAAELQQLYRGLTLPGLTLDERLDVLLHVKWAVKEFDCSLTRELVELVDREADLLNRGRSPKTLDGLRRRIAGSFLAFCKTPAFNPEAAKLQLVPGAPTEPETFEYVDECLD